MVVARKERRFESLDDFCNRIDGRLVNKRVLESLVKCGAFDSLGARRSQLLAVLDAVMESAQQAQRDRDSGQTSLFESATGSTGPARRELPVIDEFPENKILAFEKELLGIYVSGHPLARHEKAIRRYSTATTSALQKLRPGEDAAAPAPAPANGSREPRSEVIIGGLIAGLVYKTTKKGDRYAIVTLEDMEGAIEVIVWPRVFEKIGDQLRKDAIFLVRGGLDTSRDMPQVIANEFITLEQAREKLTQSVHVKLVTLGMEEATLARLQEILGRHPGKCRTFLHFERQAEQPDEAVMEIPTTVNPDDRLLAEITELLGEDVVWFSG
jgi:DNA polymerase-3 subunit alpha